jgi:lipoyl(octanoyl) transferase
MHINLVHLGRVPYADALALQQQVVAARKAGAIADTVLLLEHPPVLTLGRNSSRANILASGDLLTQRGIAIHEINRGGDVTYHGPGQLVGYPILDLRGEWPNKRGPALTKRHLGPVDYVRMLEEVLIRTCGEFGVPTHRICGRTGVWTGYGNASDACAPGTNPAPTDPTQEKKIAAIGVHVSQAVTSHGFALNVTTDLRDFQYIVPCGITDREVTSLELESPHPPSFDAVMHATARHFGHVFQRQLLAVASLEALLSAAV